MEVAKRFAGRISLCLSLIVLFAGGAKAQQVIINELNNSSLTTDEWVELLTTQDNLDLRGYSLRDYTSTGSIGATLTFSNNALWSSVPKGTLIVIGQSGFVATEDTDPSDNLLIIKATNATYFSGTVFTFAGSSDACQIRDNASTHVFGVSWGTSNASSIPSPKAHFSGSSSSNTSISYNDSTFANLTNTASWTFNNASRTMGAGNTATNIAWINNLRGNNTGDGSGIATILPDTTIHGNTYTLDITYRRDTAFSITDLRIPIPSNFIWSHSTGDISSFGTTATPSVSGDTIYFTSGTFNDSVQISIQNVTAPDSTAYYPVNVQTKAQTAYKSVTPTGRIVNFGLPQSIADVKGNDANGIMLRTGQLVTISGVVTVANQFGGPSYLQDNTGGIGIFGSIFSTSVNVGDEVLVSGKVDPFNGVSELTSPYLHEIVSSGNPVTPFDVNCNTVRLDGSGGVELYEGSLVRINTVTVTDTSGNPISSWTVSGSGTNYRLHDASGFVDVRVDNNVDFANTPTPASQFDVIGVVGQFKTGSPLIGGYQLMPRMTSDIISSGPLFATFPVESNITSSSMRISWTTVHNGTSRLRYGTTTAYEMGVIAPDNVLRSSHGINITGLQPATIYHVQAFSVASGDTSTAADLIVITASPSTSTGQVNVYFNHSVNTGVAIWENALGNQDLITKVVNRINNAQFSIDLALYSLSGTGYGSAIATALVNAKNRGVKVRVICEHDNYPTAPLTTIVSSGIPLIQDNYDLVTGGAGLMHNKFFVFDERGGAPQDIWIWTGSWNPTQPGTADDWQNSIEIQDVSLAVAYTTEFNEMWGSSTDTPNQSNSRFGTRKTDNTPHHFVLPPSASAMAGAAGLKAGAVAPLNATNASIPVELYFDPSDHTTAHIASTLHSAQASIASCILTFTRQDLADTIIARKNAGKKARILIDNNTDTGNQYAHLQSGGVDVHLKGPGSGLLHHKYVVIDGDQVNGTQKVLTGSHNWSASAENSNNENTLIIQDGRIANLYLQEFAARYYEAGGTDSIQITSSALFSFSPSSINFDSVVINQSKTDTVIVANKGNSVLNISSATSTNPKFSVLPVSASVPAFSMQSFVVTFAPDSVGLRTGKIIFAHNAPGTPDTVLVQGSGIDTTSGGGGPLTINTNVATGWNMVSLPLHLNDSRKTVVFPTAISNAFAYVGTYATRDTLVNGDGYWVKFDSAQVVSLTGDEVPGDTIAVIAGWNMFGTVSNPVKTASIVQSPPSNITSNFFGYDAGYFVEDTLKPGRAYWAKATNAGTITMLSSAASPKQAQQSKPELKNRLTFTDALGRMQTLYFGQSTETSAQDGQTERSRIVLAYELPPVPPAGGFDVRFASGRFGELIRTGEYPIEVHSAVYPVKVAWEIESQDANTYTLVSDGGSLRLTGSGEAISASATSFTLRAAAGKPIPTEYALGQNYPNPFNPTTIIPFELPRASTVSLKVFNMLGEEIVTLLNNGQRDAGYYEVPLNASQLSSGIYFYRLTAVSADGRQENFQQQKKLMLIK